MGATVAPMSSVQRLLSGYNNLARQAALAASSVRASTAIARTRVQRAGSGRVRLAGSYSGHEAAQVQVEIVAASGVPRASTPQFVGVGNGQLQVDAVDAGAPLQAFTLTLADLGVPTATAALDVRELRIRARQPGSSGNALRLTVQPQLQRQATAWALLAPWSVSSSTQQGPQWDFGGLPLSPKDELDAASPRICFGLDPQVYRPWRRFKDGAWQFGLSPALQRDVPAGTAVYGVTGGYVVTVSDGVSTEVFGDTQASPAQAPIVTFYDLLLALSASALVEVAGVVAAERTSGGQAAIDVPLRTSAWLLALSGKVQLQDVAVPAQAPTQALTVRCINADVVGQERWSVAGDVSGALPAATTGEPYSSAAAAFTVPRIVPPSGQDGRWSFKFGPAERKDGEGLPSLCVRPFRFGRNAAARTVTFRYAKRPPPDCKCSDMPTPLIPTTYLGLEENMATNDPLLMARLSAMYAWREAFVRANTEVVAAHATAGTPATPGDPGTPDIEFWTFGCMFRTNEKEARLTAGHWGTQDSADAAHALVADAWASQVLPAGTKVGDEININAVVFTVTGMYLGGHSTLDEPLSPLMLYPVSKGTYPGTPPSGGSPATGPSVVPAQFKAATRDLDWANAVFPIFLGALRQVVQHPGALSAWDALWAEACADMEMLKTSTADDLALAGMNQRFLDRYRAASDNVLLLAGILPKSDPSSADAGGCWVDPGDDHWWVDTEGYFLPAFTNQAYISCRRNTETGVPYSTMEFGFGLVVACPDRLKAGDELVLRIESVDSLRPYSVGDEAVIHTVGAGAAWLSGGVDGTDVQTWRVLGSVSGALPDYVLPTNGAPAPVYAQAGVALRLALGGIPFQLGDAFTLAVEAGQFRWRRAGGAWSALADIPAAGALALDDGLQVFFDAGAAPSFVPGDAYDFAVHQPFAASHVQDAQASAWGWEGSSAELVLDLGAAQPIGAIALARYQLPGGAAVAAQVSQDGLAWEAPLALDVSRAVSVAVFHLPMVARFVRFSVTNAPGGHIGWVWCGQPLALSNHASSCRRERRWAATRASGINAPALYAGVGDGWQLGWDERLSAQDVAALLCLGDWAQQMDEPLILLPHYLHPGDAALVRWGADALQMSDVHEYQPDSAHWRRLSATLDLDPVFA